MSICAIRSQAPVGRSIDYQDSVAREMEIVAWWEPPTSPRRVE